MRAPACSRCGIGAAGFSCLLLIGCASSADARRPQGAPMKSRTRSIATVVADVTLAASSSRAGRDARLGAARHRRLRSTVHAADADRQRRAARRRRRASRRPPERRASATGCDPARRDAGDRPRPPLGTAGAPARSRRAGSRRRRSAAAPARSGLVRQARRTRPTRTSRRQLLDAQGGQHGRRRRRT